MVPHSSTATKLHISSPSSPWVQAGGKETPKEVPRIFHYAAIDSTYLASGYAQLRGGRTVRRLNEVLDIGNAARKPCSPPLRLGQVSSQFSEVAPVFEDQV
ncbi:hypothetical protein M405DRAFT_833971 [Rhizopogon salebrosus TDB-379]|nr:hypothetical protein M405DRAFT_833971 [Rhizopogon salebrosus TDB-379]